MNNNIFLGSDPLLGGNPLQNQYQIDYNQQIAQLEAAKQQLVQQAPRISKSPIWDEIEAQLYRECMEPCNDQTGKCGTEKCDG